MTPSDATPLGDQDAEENLPSCDRFAMRSREHLVLGETPDVPPADWMLTKLRASDCDRMQQALEQGSPCCAHAAWWQPLWQPRRYYQIPQDGTSALSLSWFDG